MSLNYLLMFENNLKLNILSTLKAISFVFMCLMNSKKQRIDLRYIKKYFNLHESSKC